MDATKAAVRLVLRSFHRVFRSRDAIRADLEKNQNKKVQVLHRIVKETGENILARHQRESFMDFAEFALWIQAHDSAYHNAGDWALRRLLLQADEILPLVPEKPPEEWRINEWARRIKPP